jgi:hypothetical protein
LLVVDRELDRGVVAVELVRAGERLNGCGHC